MALAAGGLVGVGVGTGIGVGEVPAGLLVVVAGLVVAFGGVGDAFAFAVEGLVESVVLADAALVLSSGVVSLADLTSPVLLGLVVGAAAVCASLVFAAVTPMTAMDTRIATVTINVKTLWVLIKLMTLEGMARITEDLLKIIS